MFFIEFSMASIVLLSFAFTFVYNRACTPFDAYWLKVDSKWVATHKFRCFDEGVPTLVWMIISAVSKLFTTIHESKVANQTDQNAILLVSRRNCVRSSFHFLSERAAPKEAKIALHIIFGLGFSVCGTAITRIYYVYYMHRETWDVTWYSYHAFMWCTVEMFLAIIAASAPALKSYAQQWFHTPLLSRRERVSDTSRLVRASAQSGWSEVKGNTRKTVSTMCTVKGSEPDACQIRITTMMNADEQIIGLGGIERRDLRSGSQV
jgi:hypothetical protein